MSLRFSPLEIRLRGLCFYAHHGVLPQERKVGARFTLHISLWVAPNEVALHHDQLEGTISYADVYAIAERVMSQPSSLLEHVAARLLQQLMDTLPQLLRATVEVHKDNPPMGAEVESCCVVLSADRHEAP